MYLHQIWHIDSNRVPEAVLLPDLTSDKIQDGGGRQFEIYFNGYNSVAIAYIFAKFDGETENEVPQDFLESNLHQAKSNMAAAAILEFSLTAITWSFFAHIWSEFHIMIKSLVLEAVLPSKFTFDKIQDGGGRHLEILL